MMINAMGEDACLAIIALARNRPDGPFVNARVIAREFDIPRPYLAQILLRLKAAELVDSTRGTQGGYRLTRAADAISLGEVLTAIDGSGPIRRKGCGLCSPVLERIREAELSALMVLGRVTIGQLVEQAEPPDWVI
jgi:Rrf2 family transcriptional regulator, cysteine metabolism repressor